MKHLLTIDPVNTETIHYLGFELQAATCRDGFEYLTVDSLCAALTVDREPVYAELEEDSSHLGEKLAMINFPAPDGKQPLLCLRIDWVPTFILSREPNSIRDKGIREKVKHFFEISRIRLAKHYGLASEEDLRKLQKIGRKIWNDYFNRQFPETFAG